MKLPTSHGITHQVVTPEFPMTNPKPTVIQLPECAHDHTQPVYVCKSFRSKLFQLSTEPGLASPFDSNSFSDNCQKYLECVGKMERTHLSFISSIREWLLVTANRSCRPVIEERPPMENNFPPPPSTDTQLADEVRAYSQILSTQGPHSRDAIEFLAKQSGWIEFQAIAVALNQLHHNLHERWNEENSKNDVPKTLASHSPNSTQKTKP